MIVLVVVREHVAARVSGAVEKREVLERAERARRRRVLQPEQHRPVAINAVERAFLDRPALPVVPCQHLARVIDDFRASHLGGKS